jgi:hypothetical protein
MKNIIYIALFFMHLSNVLATNTQTNTNKSIRASYLMKYINKKEYNTIELNETITNIMKNYDPNKTVNQYNISTNLIDTISKVPIYREILRKSNTKVVKNGNYPLINLELIIYRSPRKWSLILDNKNITKLKTINKEYDIKLESVEVGYIILSINKPSEQQIKNAASSNSIHRSQVSIIQKESGKIAGILVKLKPRQTLDTQTMLIFE